MYCDNQKKTDVAILIADKADIQVKSITRDNEGSFIMTRVDQQKGITIKLHVQYNSFKIYKVKR